MIKKFFQSRLNILTYGSLAALAAFFFLFKMATGFGGGLDFRTSAYYFGEAGNSLKLIALGGAYLAALFLLFLVIMSQVRNIIGAIRGKGARPMMVGSDTVRGTLRNTGSAIVKALSVLGPAFLFIIVMSFVLDGLNAVGRARLMDGSLIRWDQILLGGFAFLRFGTAAYPAPLIKFVIFSFDSMSGILIGTGFLLACLCVRYARGLVASFCLSMLFMVPFWLAFPALSPQDRFIDNVYRLPVSTQIAAAVAAYRPDRQIADFLAEVRVEKGGMGDMPTSTMPSAHTAWALLVGYYLFRLRRGFGWAVLPFLVASTAGTVILAQHYFIDIVLSLAITAFAIWVVERIAKREAAGVTSPAGVSRGTPGGPL